MCDINKEVPEIICDKTKILNLLVKRVSLNVGILNNNMFLLFKKDYKPIDDNKLYCSEILNILL